MIFSDLGRPGPARIAVVWLLGCLAAGISIWLVFHDHGEPIETAVAIGAVSLLLFTIAAVLTSDCVRGWHCIEYGWVAATFVTVFAALSNISEANRLRALSESKLQVLGAFSDLIYTGRQILESDCKIRPPGENADKPPPLIDAAACERVDRFLPQMDLQYRDADRGGSTEPMKKWSRDLVCPPDSTPPGAWSELCNESEKLQGKIGELATVVADNPPPTAPISRVMIDGGIRYWYYALAFVVGLRLALVTAVLLRSRRTRARG
jgi:hypothetical protein